MLLWKKRFMTKYIYLQRGNSFSDCNTTGNTRHSLLARRYGYLTQPDVFSPLMLNIIQNVTDLKLSISVAYPVNALTPNPNQYFQTQRPHKIVPKRAFFAVSLGGLPRRIGVSIHSVSQKLAGSPSVGILKNITVSNNAVLSFLICPSSTMSKS